MHLARYFTQLRDTHTLLLAAGSTPPSQRLLLIPPAPHLPRRRPSYSLQQQPVQGYPTQRRANALHNSRLQRLLSRHDPSTRLNQLSALPRRPLSSVAQQRLLISSSALLPLRLVPSRPSPPRQDGRQEQASNPSHLVQLLPPRVPPSAFQATATERRGQRKLTDRLTVDQRGQSGPESG